ncbi:efflux RND transporter permease subunit [Patescibacteria group bacterium]|nr:efflux RND transporter permease subunit [Patescibacteria group bacterium]
MDNENNITKLSQRDRSSRQARDREINRKRIEETRAGFFGFFIKRWRLAILMVIGMAVWGFLSLMELPREAQPEVQIPIVVVTTVYPGASPGDIEELITDKVEEKIDGLENIASITSNSSFGVSSVVVEFEAGADLVESVRNLRDRADTISGLPSEAEDPMVMEIRINDFAIITFSLIGDLTDGQLKEIGERAQDELENIKGVSRVDLLGARQREFNVVLNQAKMNQFGLGINQVVGAISASNVNFPLGTVEVGGMKYNVRSTGKFESIEDLGNVVVKSNQSGLIFLKDIADIKDQLAEKSTVSRVSLNGGSLQNVVSLQVYKKTGGNIIDIIDVAKEHLDDLKKKEIIPKNVTVEVVSDMSQFIRDDLNTLGKSGIQTFILIFILLSLALALRQAMIAALAVPLIFLGTFGVLKMQGQTLNSLTLFSLVLSLGLLVDTLIIILEGLHDNLMKGYTPEESALLSVSVFKWPLIAGVLTTISAFVPMFLVSGVVGEFLKTMPLTISATLGISLLVALIIIPSLAARVIKRRASSNFLESNSNISNSKNSSPLEEIRGVEKEHLMEKYFTKPLQKRYHNFIRKLLYSKKRRRGLAISVIAAFIISMGALVFGFIPLQMFPKYDVDFFVVNIELPNGSILEETEKKVQLVEYKLLETPEIESFVTNVGSGGGLAFTGFGPSGGASENLAAVTVNLYEKGKRNREIEKLEIKKLRDANGGVPNDSSLMTHDSPMTNDLPERTSYEIAADLRSAFKKIDGAKVSVTEIEEGPPAAEPVEARITGDDLAILDRIASDIEGMLSEIPGAVEVDTGVRVSPPEFGFRLKHEELGRYNLNAAVVSGILRSAIYGSKASTVTREGTFGSAQALREDIDIRVQYLSESVDTVEALKNLMVMTPTGENIALSQIADFELTPALENISHRDLKRIVSVAAKNQERTPVQILADLQDKLEDYDLPEGYEIIYGGEQEQMEEVFTELYYAMIVAVLLILLILILEFNSFKQPLIIILTLPMAMIGVVVGLRVLGLAFSFPAFLGLVGLAGIVVNDAIILIDRINNNLQERKMELVEAIAEAGEARLQPIFLTTVTTIAGIMPLYFANEFWQGLSVAMIFGLAFSTILTLSLVPVLYRWLEGKKMVRGANSVVQ